MLFVTRRRLKGRRFCVIGIEISRSRCVSRERANMAASAGGKSPTNAPFELFCLDASILELQAQVPFRFTGNLVFRVDFTCAEGRGLVDMAALRAAFEKVQQSHRMLRCVVERVKMLKWLAVEVVDGLPVPFTAYESAGTLPDGQDRAAEMVRAFLNKQWSDDVEVSKREAHADVAASQAGERVGAQDAGGDAGKGAAPAASSTSHPPPPRRYEVGLGLVAVPSARWHALVVVINHCVSDLMAMHTVARELLVALSGEGGEPASRNDDAHYTTVLHRLTPGFLKTLWRGRSAVSDLDAASAAVVKTCPSNAEVRVARNSPRHTLLAVRHIPADVSAALREGAKAAGITLHGPLCAAALYAQLRRAESSGTLKLSKLRRGPPCASDADAATYLLPFAPSVELRRRLKAPPGDADAGSCLLSADSVQSNSWLVVYDVPMALRVTEGAPFAVSHGAFWDTAKAVCRLQNEADASQGFLYIPGILSHVGKSISSARMKTMDKNQQPIVVGNSGAFNPPPAVRAAGIVVEGGCCCFSQVHASWGSAPYVCYAGFPNGTIGVTLQATHPFITQEVLDSQADACVAFLAEYVCFWEG